METLNKAQATAIFEREEKTMQKDTTQTTYETREHLQSEIARLAAAADYRVLVFVRAFLRADAARSAQDVPSRA